MSLPSVDGQWRKILMNSRCKSYVIDPKIAELYASGVGTATIGKLYGTRREAVREKLISAGIARRPRRENHVSVSN